MFFETGSRRLEGEKKMRHSSNTNSPTQILTRDSRH